MSPSRESVNRQVEPIALHDRAEDQLRFIRDTMARAGSFTSASGSGMMMAGVCGLAASGVTLLVPLDRQPAQWLMVWLGAALAAITVSSLAIRAKALRTGQLLSGAAARTFALAFAPGLVAGALLTAVLVRTDAYALLPGTWLVTYGAAVTSGGAFSVRPVPVMGATFLVLGAGCFAAPAPWSPIFLAAGFGGAHLWFGYAIARHHNG